MSKNWLGIASAIVVAAMFSLNSCTLVEPDDDDNNNNNNNNNTEVDPNDPDIVKPADLLTDDKYHHIVFEIAGNLGAWSTNVGPVWSKIDGPSNKSISNFTSFVLSHVNKSGKIFFRYDSIGGIGKDEVTTDDLKGYAKVHRKNYVNGDTVFVWIAVVDAKTADDVGKDIELGTTFGGSQMVIFLDELNRISLPDMVSRFTLETYILEHEFGHMLGLVNNGTEMVEAHQDEDHGNHCTNTQCLMYWRADENLVLVDLLGEVDVIPVLDAKCKADIIAAGGK